MNEEDARNVAQSVIDCFRVNELWRQSGLAS